MEKSKKGWIIGIVCGAIFLSLLITFFALSKDFYLGSFAPNAKVSNTDVGSLSVLEALEAMNNAEGFTISVSKDGKAYNLDISEAVDRKFDYNQVHACRDEISFWDYLFHNEVSYSLKPQETQVDADKVQEIMESQLPKPDTYTKDAYFNDDMDLVKEIQGDDVDYESFLSTLQTDIAEGNERNYELSDYYNSPQVKAEDEEVAGAAGKISKYKDIEIIFTFGKKEEIIDWNVLEKYVTYKNGKLKLKTKWVSDYVREMAKKYNTYGKTRTFKTTKDGKVTVKGGILGWWINEDATAKKIKTLLKKGKSKTLEPVYRNVAGQHGKDDIGKTYVEVSLTRQKLWFYKNGKLKLKSDIVTGLPTKERETLKGAHRVFAKETDRYLGTMAVQGYHTHVNYWMPFNWSGQGFHDATWRSKFGGTLYKTGGSHGCVNMPLTNAAKLYKMIEVGTPVVVY